MNMTIFWDDNMDVLIVGSLAYDSLETPFGAREDELGGSASYGGFSAAFHNRRLEGKGVGLVGVIGEDFKSDLGFVRRTDLFKITPQYKLKFYPEDKNLTQWDMGVGMWSYFRPNDNFRNSDRTISPSINFVYKNGIRTGLRFYFRSTYLYNDFDPTGLNPENPIPGENLYKYASFKFTYNSDVRKIFSYRVEPDIGQFYTGMKYSIENSLRWRLQPFLSTSLSLNYDHIDLGNGFSPENIWLIRPKVDFTFTKNIF